MEYIGCIVFGACIGLFVGALCAAAKENERR